MTDASRTYYEVLLINEQTGEEQSLGVGRDFQAMINRDLALRKLTQEQHAEG
jgi:hypothetical protein